MNCGIINVIKKYFIILKNKSMKFFDKFDFKLGDVLKIAGLGLAGIIILVFLFKIIGASFNSVLPKNGKYVMRENTLSGVADSAYGAKMDSAYSTDASGEIGLSLRNVASSKAVMPPSAGGITTGDNAEDFEVTEYNTLIETGESENACSLIAGLKDKDYVIFENTNKYDRGCNYRFKVKQENVGEILDVLKKLEPKELAENIHTIKRLVDDFTSEEEILEKKKNSVEETLNSAIKAYDEISAIATGKQDAETLAKIVDSKMRLIEQLAQERININTQLDRLSRAKADQLDRLTYTFFNVNVIENKFVNGDDLKDSWKASVKKFVADINKTVQGITISLVTFIFLALQYIIYLSLLLIAAKYLWRAAKYVWKK